MGAEGPSILMIWTMGYGKNEGGNDDSHEGARANIDFTYKSGCAIPPAHCGLPVVSEKKGPSLAPVISANYAFRKRKSPLTG